MHMSHSLYVLSTKTTFLGQCKIFMLKEFTECAHFPFNSQYLQPINFSVLSIVIHLQAAIFSPLHNTFSSLRLNCPLGSDSQRDAFGNEEKNLKLQIQMGRISEVDLLSGIICSC